MRYPTEFKSAYKSCNSALKQAVQIAKKAANDKHIATSVNKTRAMWEIIKKHTTPFQKPSENITLQYNDTNITNPKCIADTFNTFFTEIGELLSQNNQQQTANHNITKLKINCNSMYLIETNKQEVLDLINELDNKFSAGPDGIPDFIVKTSAQYIAEPLTHIFNSSFESGIFPNTFKEAIIKPLFKKGDRFNITNYRPISLLSSFAKILEKLFHKRLRNFLTHNNILSSYQHGFRKQKSTDTAIFQFLNDIVASLDNNDIPVGLFLDLSKAFDTVNHHILLRKLEQYGVRGTPLSWITSYLSNRTQRVQIHHTTHNNINNILSSPRRINCGIPQGSILGPCLFILYINDLPSALDYCKPVLFADDTSILGTGSSADPLYKSIQADVNKLTYWLNINKLVINATKTELMEFHNSQKRIHHCTIDINNSILNQVSTTKFLGLWIQDNLKWDTHVQNLNTKISRTAYALRILINSTSLETALCAYFANVHSHIRYGIIFWGNSPSSKLTFKIHKRIIVMHCTQTISCR